MIESVQPAAGKQMDFLRVPTQRDLKGKFAIGGFLVGGEAFSGDAFVLQMGETGE